MAPIDRSAISALPLFAGLWLNLARSQGDHFVSNTAAEDRDRVAARMTREQIAEAQKLAREWKPTK